jgi:hypothetical protein
MNLNDHDFEAEQAAFMTLDWLREAIKEVDSLLGKGFASKNPALLGDFIQAASRKYHASVLNQNNPLEHIVNSLDGIAESIDCAGAKAPLADAVITALRNEQFLAGLSWLRQNPQHTKQEYLDAMAEFEKLIGL